MGQLLNALVDSARKKVLFWVFTNTTEMVTCFLKYIIDPQQVREFERYGKFWIDYVNNVGGIHHGYLLPYEGANTVGYASFSFASLSKYEKYREDLGKDSECTKVLEEANKRRFIVSYERSFMKPVFEGIKDHARLR